MMESGQIFAQLAHAESNSRNNDIDFFHQKIILGFTSIGTIHTSMI